MNFPQLIESDNIGGVLFFYFIPVSDVISIPRPWKGNVPSIIELLPGKEFFAGYSTYNQLSFSNELVNDPAGCYYRNSVKGFYPKPSAALLA